MESILSDFRQKIHIGEIQMSINSESQLAFFGDDNEMNMDDEDWKTNMRGDSYGNYSRFLH